MSRRGGDNAMVAAISAGRNAPKALAKIKGKAPEMDGKRTPPAASDAPMTYAAAGAKVKASRL